MENADIDNLEGAGNDDSEKQSNPEIVPDVAMGFTYASYQNAIPVIRSIRIANLALLWQIFRAEPAAAVRTSC